MSAAQMSGRRSGRTWRALGILVVLGAIGGLAVSASTRPAYTATAESFISTTAAASVADLAQGNDLALQAERSYAGLATTPRVLDRVIDTLGLRTTAAALANQVTVEQPADTAVLRFSVIDPSADRAAAIVGAVQTELGRQVRALAPTTGDSRTAELTSITTVQVPRQRSSPNTLLDTALGALIGGGSWLIMRLVVAVLRRRPPASGGIAAPSML